MKVWGISDTHGMHDRAIIPENIDCIIYGGDSTNYKHLGSNEQEFYKFKQWFLDLKIKNKIIIPGNHDAWATKKYNIEDLTSNGVIYLEHNITTIEGITIFGSPYTPSFEDWYFMKDRGKLDKYWNQIPGDIDILITHGPPQGILDLSRNRLNELEYCGDKSLLRHVLKIKPKFHIFGHIHNFNDCKNQGIRIYENIQFMNVSCVEDGRFDKGLTSNGIVFEI